MKPSIALAACVVMLNLGLLAQGQASPAAVARTSVNGNTLQISYSAPSVRGRQIFGAGGLVSKDGTYPVWRAGANDATAFHTDADLLVGTLAVPKGDYTLFVLVQDPNAWQLIVNKQTGQWGLTYDPKQDLGRVPMKMAVPPSPIEQLKYLLTNTGANAVTLTLEWERHVATVPITVK
jgi:hypothetical protein